MCIYTYTDIYIYIYIYIYTHIYIIYIMYSKSKSYSLTVSNIFKGRIKDVINSLLLKMQDHENIPVTYKLTAAIRNTVF